MTCAQFNQNMLESCDISEEQFILLCTEIKAYRDKFVAHLDNRIIMNIPDLNNALKLVYFLYQFIWDKLSIYKKYNLPEDLKEYYEACISYATNYYPTCGLFED